MFIINVLYFENEGRVYHIIIVLFFLFILLIDSLILIDKINRHEFVIVTQT